MQDIVFVSRSGSDSIIVALDSKNGDKKWEKKFGKTFLDSFILWQGNVIANLFDEKGQVLYALSQTDGSKFYFTNIRNIAPKEDSQTNISPMSVFGDYLIMPTRSNVVCVMGALSGMERYRIKTQEPPSVVVPTLEGFMLVPEQYRMFWADARRRLMFPHEADFGSAEISGRTASFTKELPARKGVRYAFTGV